MFAVNKSATKVPVGGAVEGATFPTDYNMMVAAYLAAGDATPGVYFTDKVFSKNGNEATWTGGQYWPVSAATLNFVAIAPETEDEDQVTTKISKIGETGVATVTIANNETNLYDVMYAVGQSVKTAGQQPEKVDMVFKHALSWVYFNFKTTNNANDVTIKINSVKINNAACNGTLTVTSAKYTTTEDQEASTSWSNKQIDDIAVPGAGIELTENYQSFGDGLLVVPDVQATDFVINYTITQSSDQVEHTFDYTYPLTSAWDAAKKYTYAVTITLSKIEINPSVEDWGDPVEEEINVDEEVDNTPAEENTTA